MSEPDAWSTTHEPPCTGAQCTVCTTHGDYWPGNVLVDTGRRAITAIVDWDGVATARPPAVDTVHFELHADSMARSAGFGSVVAERSREADVLLAWLWHVDTLALRSPVTQRDARWRQANVELVLDTFA